MRGHVLRNVQRQRRLAHRRTRRQDQQLAAVQAARHFIELGEAGAETAHALAGIQKRVDATRKFSDYRGWRFQTFAGAGFAEFQQRLFGARQNFVRFLFADQAAVNHLLRAEDQLAQRGLVLDDAYVTIEIAERRQPFIERDQVREPVHRFDLPLLHQLIGERDAVDLFAAVVQVLHARENAAMLFEAEVFVLNRARDLEIGVLVQQNRAEHKALSIDVGGKSSLESEIDGGHGKLRDRSKVAP